MAHGEGSRVGLWAMIWGPKKGWGALQLQHAQNLTFAPATAAGEAVGGAAGGGAAQREAGSEPVQAPQAAGHGRRRPR